MWAAIPMFAMGIGLTPLSYESYSRNSSFALNFISTFFVPRSFRLDFGAAPTSTLCLFLPFLDWTLELFRQYDIILAFFSINSSIRSSKPRINKIWKWTITIFYKKLNMTWLNHMHSEYMSTNTMLPVNN